MFIQYVRHRSNLSVCVCVCVRTYTMNISQLIERYLAVCNNMNGSRGYAK